MPPAGVAVAVSEVLWPAHRFVSGDVIVTTALLFIVNVIESTAVHPVMLSVMLTVYLTVPAAAVTVGLATAVLLRFVAGDHR